MKIRLLLVNLFVFTTNLYPSEKHEPASLYEVRIVFAKDVKFTKISRYFLSFPTAFYFMKELNELNSYPVTNYTSELTPINMRKVFDKIDMLTEEMTLVCPTNSKTQQRIPPTSFYIEQIRKVITP